MYIAAQIFVRWTFWCIPGPCFGHRRYFKRLEYLCLPVPLLCSLCL